jgi:hypothetical protein
MGGREEVVLKREIIIAIMFLESVTTILINPYVKRATMCR